MESAFNVTATTTAMLTNPIKSLTVVGEIDADRAAADSSSITVMDTSKQNLTETKTPPPLPDSKMDDDEEQTDAYSDDETIPDTNIEPQIPANNDEIVEPGNDAVDKSTDNPLKPELTVTQTETNKK